MLSFTLALATATATTSATTTSTTALPSSPPEADPTYAAELIAAAEDRALHEARQWQLLLHYQGRWFGGKKSQADGVTFFADSDGKFDPEEELAATLEAFFEPTLDDEHPQCVFAARFKWLNEQLEFDPARMPVAPCPQLEHYLEVMDPASVSLIFASAYMNAPPSMYGHTFLRIDRRTAPGVVLLSHILNYSAVPTTYNPLFYTLAGIFGGFEGRFQGMPYYVKIREYSDLESRDLWEYQLSLTRDQIDMMLRHTWELDRTYFRYFFFDENCSYHLLSLLDVADPSLRLADRFNAWVIPTDTLKAVLDTEGLVVDRTFRPSHSRKMRARAQRLQGDEPSAVAKLARRFDEERFDVLDGRPPERRALVLESAHDLFKYKHGFENITGKMKKKSLEELKRNTKAEREILERRSAIPLQTAEATVETPIPPEEGHGSSRAGAAGGVETDGKGFIEVEWRAAFHDFSDRQAGYVEDSELEMLALALRVLPAQAGSADVVVLERLDAVNIMSVAPWRRWTRPISWRVSAGYGRVDDLGCHRWECTAFELHGGPGLAFSTNMLNRETFYVFTDLQFEAGPAFRNAIRFGGDVAAGFGIELTSWWRLTAEGRIGYHPVGDSRTEPLYQVKGVSNFALGKNVAIRLKGGYFRRAQEAQAGLLLYF
jgi:hypothetical protein